MSGTEGWRRSYAELAKSLLGRALYALGLFLVGALAWRLLTWVIPWWAAVSAAALLLAAGVLLWPFFYEDQSTRPWQPAWRLRGAAVLAVISVVGVTIAGIAWPSENGISIPELVGGPVQNIGPSGTGDGKIDSVPPTPSEEEYAADFEHYSAAQPSDPEDALGYWRAAAQDSEELAVHREYLRRLLDAREVAAFFAVGESLMEGFPSSPGVFVEYADGLSRLGNWTEDSLRDPSGPSAKEILERGLAANPDSYWMLREVVTFLAEDLGRGSDVVGMLQPAAVDATTSSSVRFLLGFWGYDEVGRFSDALAAVRMAAEDSPSYMTWYGLAWLLTNRRTIADPATALEAVENGLLLANVPLSLASLGGKALAAYPSTTDHVGKLDEVLGRHLGDPVFAVLSAYFHAETGALDLAVSELQGAMALLSPADKEPYLAVISSWLEESGRVPEAIAMYSDELLDDPRPSYHAERGRLRASDGDRDGGYGDLIHAIELAGSFSEQATYWYQLGLLYEQGGLLALAAPAIEAAIELDPAAPYIEKRAEQRRAVGDISGAEADYEAVAYLASPASSQYVRAIRALTEMSAEREPPDPSLSIDRWSEAVAANPNNTELRLAAAEALAAHPVERPDLSIELLEIPPLGSTWPTDAGMELDAARAGYLADAGRDDEAARVWRDLVPAYRAIHEALPGEKYAHDDYAEVLARSGASIEAIEQFTELLESETYELTNDDRLYYLGWRAAMYEATGREEAAQRDRGDRVELMEGQEP